MNSVAPAPTGASKSIQTLYNTVLIHRAHHNLEIAPPPSYDAAIQQCGAHYGAQAPIRTQPVVQPPPGGHVPSQGRGPGFVIPHVQQGGAIAAMAPGSVRIQPEVRWLQVEQVPGCQPCLSALVALKSIIMQDESGFFIPDGNIELRNKLFKVLTPQGFAIFAGKQKYSRNSFKCSITDQGGQEAVRVNAVFECCWGIFRCCDSNINIEAPAGNSLGQMKQVCHLTGNTFALQYHDGQTVEFTSYVVGPSSTITITQGQQEIGNIMGPALSPPSPNGCIGATCVQINFFGEVDVKIKAGIMGALSFLAERFYTIDRRPGAQRRARRRRRRR